MSVIHRTTVTPTKLELLADWLPAQSWYAGTAGKPDLAKAGGFRLDDPAGEVGIEFMVVTDSSGAQPVSYHVPFSYRGAPLEGAERGLIGTSEHGVLGRRWIYDGTHDPVLVAQLLALLQGRAEPQHQNETDTPDPTVVVHPTESGLPGPGELTAVADGENGTAVTVTSPADSTTLHVARVLRPETGPGPVATGGGAHVTAGWRLPDGTESRAVFAFLRDGGR
jgi:hypothetical protein